MAARIPTSAYRIQGQSTHDATAFWCHLESPPTDTKVDMMQITNKSEWGARILLYCMKSMNEEHFSLNLAKLRCGEKSKWRRSKKRAKNGLQNVEIIS